MAVALILVVCALAAGCGEDSIRATAPASTTEPAPAGRIWARSVADNRVHELDGHGRDLGVVDALDGVTGWGFAVVSPSLRYVAFTDSEPRLVVLDRETGRLRAAPNLSCFAFRKDDQLIASTDSAEASQNVGLVDIASLPGIDQLDAPPPTWVPLGGAPLDQPCPHRLDDDVSLLQVGSPANAADKAHQQLLRLDADWATTLVLDLPGCNAGTFRASPDGSQLAANLVCRKERDGLYLYDVDSMERRRIAEGRIASPCWSPDGSALVFVRAPSPDSTPESMRLFTVNADGTGERQLGEKPYLFPVWLD